MSIIEIAEKIRAEAPEHLKDSMLQALFASCHLVPGQAPLSPAEIAQKFDQSLDALIYFSVILTKRDAADFLFELGFAQSPALIEKQMLKEGRYRERFGRDVSTFKNKNIYSYAELMAIIDRPLLQEKFLAQIEKAKLPA